MKYEELVSSHLEYGTTEENIRVRKGYNQILENVVIAPWWSHDIFEGFGFEVVQTSEKRPISNIASTGCCYFRKGSDFVESAFSVIEKDVNTQGQYYISATFNEMVLNNRKIGIFEIPKKDYLTFSNYQMYEKHLEARNK